MLFIHSKFIERAAEKIDQDGADFTEEDFLELLDDLGWFELFQYNDMGQGEVALSPAQKIGLAAVLHAVRRSRDEE